jgi:hypothetical protein
MRSGILKIQRECFTITNSIMGITKAMVFIFIVLLLVYFLEYFFDDD